LLAFGHLQAGLHVPAGQAALWRYAMTIQNKVARDYMTRDLVTLAPQTEILQALQTLIKRDVAGAPVVDGSGTLLGMLTEKDCMQVALNATYHSEYGGVVADFMSSPAVSISPDAGVVEVVKLFLENRYHRYPVVENGRLIGQVSRRDVMRALGDGWQ
jgi:CBS domain-containing protein